MMAMSGAVKTISFTAPSEPSACGLVPFDSSSFLGSGGITATGRTPQTKKGRCYVISSSSSWRTEVDCPGLIRRHWPLACHPQMAESLARAQSAQ
jgi:hypothetical protein